MAVERLGMRTNTVEALRAEVARLRRENAMLLGQPEETRQAAWAVTMARRKQREAAARSERIESVEDACALFASDRWSASMSAEAYTLGIDIGERKTWATMDYIVDGEVALAAKAKQEEG